MLDWSKIDPNDDKTRIRVVFYGRVSTEHEMQQDAFENQIKWYYDQLDRHNNWILVKPIETYLDKGITGTQAKKRPGFQAMIKDAEHDLFDMIVTRENSRFARNTEESLKYVRILRERDIQVYFVIDGIRTIQDSDASLKLGLMATFAEQESRKISDRVKAGQYASQLEGVLYGTGNVLGYNRVRKVRDDDKKGRIKDKTVPTFEIDPDQAETVRMIFNLYEQGLGLRRIQNELLKTKRLNASGICKWDMANISRILENTMYIGKQRQHQTEVIDPIGGRKKHIAEDEQILIDGDFEPIISEEQFYSVQQIKGRKEAERIKTSSGLVGKGGTVTDDKWVDKLECGCGSRFRKYRWYQKNGAPPALGYSCSNRVINGSLEYRIKKGIYNPEEDEDAILSDTDVTDETGAPVKLYGSDICSLKTIPRWHLELMVKKVFEYITGIQRDRIIHTYEVIKENYVSEQSVDVSKIKNHLCKLELKLDRLEEMYLEGDIDKAKYKEKNDQLKKEKQKLESELNQNINPQDNMKVEDLGEVLDTILSLIDPSEEIDPAFLKKYVDKVIVRSDHCFEFMVGLRGDSVKFIENTRINSNEKYAEKRKHTDAIQQTEYDTMFSDRIDFKTAHEYRKAQGTYLRVNQWDDLYFTVYIRN